MAAVVLVNWLLPARFRPVFILAASYFFYAWWNAPMLLLVLGLTATNYAAGRLAFSRPDARRRWVVAGVAVNLLALAAFKYVGLLDDSANRLAAILGLPDRLPVVRALLPLGLSFFAFEFIHYLIEIHRGREPIRSPIRFALFPAFFPTQIAGPIKRYPDFDAQARSRPAFDSVLFVEGLELIARGLVKKVLLADTLMPIVDRGFAAPGGLGTADSLAAVIGFGFQIYLDFSGYTDIGRGSAQLLGYRVPENFQAPYLATSLRDFWRRWHITLSSWLRDYLYIPLGGNRKGRTRESVNLLATMALGGLWHGAAWHFVVWGFGHGALLIANHRLRGALRNRSLQVVGGWLLTQSAVMLLWVLFRAPDLGSAGAVLAGLLHPGRHSYRSAELGVVGAIALTVLAWHLAAPHLRSLWKTAPAALVLRPAAIAAGLLVASAYTTVALQRVHTFIYFQF